MAKIEGIDISYWQGNINFKEVAADGIKFAVIREGYRATVDKNFIDYVKGCQQYGIDVMIYHFIYTDGATIAQNAQATYDNLKKAGLDSATTWIAADLEEDTWIKNGERCTKASCTKYLKQYLNCLKSLGCNNLFIYTNNDYYQNYLDWSQLNYPVWLADYEGNPNHNCVMQQYTDEGWVEGINGSVDMDYLFDENMLKKATSTPTLNKVLFSRGKKGTEVKNVQNMLIALGYSCGSYGADGDFGSYTETAIKRFQKDNNLKQSGKYDTDTQTKLTELYNAKLKADKEKVNSIVGGVTAQDILDVFRGWIGCSRSAGTHKKIIDLYNSYSPLARGYKVTYSDAYCDTTVSAAFIKLNAVNLIGGTECGVENHVAIFKKAGIWEEDGTVVPKPGWIIVFNWDDGVQPNNGYSDHIGIVESVVGNKITTIEGNMNGGKVDRRTINVGWGYIRGYAIPKYADTHNENVTNVIIGNVETDKKPIAQNSNKKIDYAESFKSSIAKTYTTTAHLNMRTGASMAKEIITTIPLGAQVKCYGYYTKDWYYVQYGNYVGFCNKTYLK